MSFANVPWARYSPWLSKNKISYYLLVDVNEKKKDIIKTNDDENNIFKINLIFYSK